MQRHGWTLLFHEGLIEQLRKVQAAALHASDSELQRLDGNANATLFQALSHWVMDAVPGDPSRDAFRHCNIAEPAHSNWRCAKIGGRFRLFFRYDARAKVIVFAALQDWTALDAAVTKGERQRMTKPHEER
jgi:toxin YhaV